MQHILLENAIRSKNPSKDISPKGCSFDEIKGYWLTDDTKEILMISNRALASATKKWDRETGEDKKGE